jgi:alkylhydroperoxidase family enzyme
VPELSYDASPVPIRDDLHAAHQATWRHIAAPGTWLSGETRVAIAAEVRHAPGCALCQSRREALSPNAIDGEHGGRGILSAAIVEVIHRIVTDPARLTRDWYSSLIDSGLDETDYVETVAVICMTIAIDTFARSMGMSPPPLPDPVPGDPSRIRPPEAKPGAAWVPWIAPEDAAAFTDEVFAPEASNVQRALTLVPDECRAFFRIVAAQYLSRDQMRDFDNEYRAITHAQIELLAGRVSAINQCAY